MNKAPKLIMVGVLAMILFTACSELTSFRKGWVCVNPENGFDCRYSLFTGEETTTLELEEGDSVSLSYDLEITAGELKIKFLDPSDQILWQFDAIETISNLIEVQVLESGRYSIVVVGDNAEGMFNIVWDVIE